MQRIGLKVLAGLALNIAVLAMGGDLKAAETDCKGLEQTACQVNSVCSWVKAHKIKTGKEIAAFCRRKPGQKSVNSAPTGNAPVLAPPVTATASVPPAPSSAAAAAPITAPKP